MRLSRGEEDDSRAFYGHSAQAGCLAKDPLAPVPVDCVTQPLRCNKGDLFRAAFVIPQNCCAHEPMIDPLATGEDLLKFLFGFDGLHGFPRQ